VESKWKNYHITTFPGQSLSKNRETQFGRDCGPGLELERVVIFKIMHK
jgi:hypothetical protein